MRRRLATLALLLAVAILLPPVARGEGQERAIPNVERWRPCETRRPYPFFETVFCMNPNGSGEIGAHAYHLTARGRVFLGKAAFAFHSPNVILNAQLNKLSRVAERVLARSICPATSPPREKVPHPARKGR